MQKSSLFWEYVEAAIIVFFMVANFFLFIVLVSWN